MVILVFFLTFCNYHTLYFQILINWPTLLYSQESSDLKITNKIWIYLLFHSWWIPIQEKVPDPDLQHWLNYVHAMKLCSREPQPNLTSSTPQMQFWAIVIDEANNKRNSSQFCQVPRIFLFCFEKSRAQQLDRVFFLASGGEFLRWESAGGGNSFQSPLWESFSSLSTLEFWHCQAGIPMAWKKGKNCWGADSYLWCMLLTTPPLPPMFPNPKVKI